MPRPVPHNRIQIKERRENILAFLTKGMKGYEIAKELGVDASTVSRDIHYLIDQSQNYLSSLAKETLPFMYQTSIEGIRNILKECWIIYTTESNKEITWILFLEFSYRLVLDLQWHFRFFLQIEDHLHKYKHYSYDLFKYR